MKIRSGFVSNSSSSSFVFVGFNKSDLDDKSADFKTKVKSKLSIRDINKFALEYFEDDVEYNKFCKGVNIPDDFWKAIHTKYSADFDGDDVPDGYMSRLIYENETREIYWGIDVAYVSDCGTDEFSVKNIIDAQKQIENDFPRVKSKIILGCSSS